ncbi:MAG: BlaI/MecI/CopY family transcriptional regulator [Planctomycetota bacterium]
MSKKQTLSNAETEVARVLWGLGEATARQVTDAMPPGQRRDFSTIQTYLSRLEAKGYVESSRVGRTKLFAPLIKPSMVIRETVDDLVERLFGGEAFSLLKHLVADRDVTAEELAELRQLIDSLETKRHGTRAADQERPDV